MTCSSFLCPFLILVPARSMKATFPPIFAFAHSSRFSFLARLRLNRPHHPFQRIQTPPSSNTSSLPVAPHRSSNTGVLHSLPHSRPPSLSFTPTTPRLPSPPTPGTPSSLFQHVIPPPLPIYPSRIVDDTVPMSQGRIFHPSHVVDGAYSVRTPFVRSAFLLMHLFTQI